jgi:broad specificity phosphatase PhoE
MNVYLFRHGQKGSEPSRDPDLTLFGHQQARKLAQLVGAGSLSRGTHFLASPRLRAQSTLTPAASLCESRLEIVADLDQREGYEDSTAFRARIRAFLTGLEKKFAPGDVVYLCTHHDWIEEALALIPADRDLLESSYWTWSPAQYMHFEVTGGLWQLRHYDRIDS